MIRCTNIKRWRKADYKQRLSEKMLPRVGILQKGD